MAVADASYKFLFTDIGVYGREQVCPVGIWAGTSDRHPTALGGKGRGAPLRICRGRGISLKTSTPESLFQKQPEGKEGHI